MKIHVRTDNAAFADHGAGPELARILRELADRIDREGDQPGRGEVWPIMDRNGNRVGTVRR